MGHCSLIGCEFVPTTEINSTIVIGRSEVFSVCFSTYKDLAQHHIIPFGELSPFYYFCSVLLCSV